MKTAISLILAFAMSFCLAACGEGQQQTPTADPTEDTEGLTVEATVDPNWIPYADSVSGIIALAATDRSSEGLTAEKILNFCSWEIFHSYIYEQKLATTTEKYQVKIGQETFLFNQYSVPENVVFGVVEQLFVTDDFTYEMLRASSRYNSEDKTFLCTEPICFDGNEGSVLAYEKLGGNDYQLYVEARVNNHPGSPCSECATTDECVLERVLFCVIVSGAPKISPVIVSFWYTDSIPDTAIMIG